MSDYRNVFSLIAAVGFLQLAGGLLGVVTPLGLESLGVDAFAIGIIAALHAAGFMAGAASAPAALGLFGNIRVYAAAAAVAAAGTLGMQLSHEPVSWTVIRILQGAAFAWMFASAEAWLSDAVSARNRGGVTGLYHVVAKAALLIGPFFIIGGSALDASVFAWTGLFLCLTIVPICLTRQGQPAAPTGEPLSLPKLFDLAPAAVIGVFLAGVVNTGTLALLPVYAERVSPDAASGTGAAAIAMAMAWFGGLVSQWPAGRISDKYDRRIIIAALAGIAAVAAGGLGFATGLAPLWLVFVLLALWGAGALSFYGVCVAHAIDRSERDQIANVMSGLLFVWAGGSVVGPPLSGLAMRTPFGPGGLFILAAALLVALVGAMAVRLTQRDEPSNAQQEPFEIAQPTSVAAADFDPRGEASGPDAASPKAPDPV